MSNHGSGCWCRWLRYPVARQTRIAVPAARPSSAAARGPCAPPSGRGRANGPRRRASGGAGTGRAAQSRNRRARPGAGEDTVATLGAVPAPDPYGTLNSGAAAWLGRRAARDGDRMSDGVTTDPTALPAGSPGRPERSGGPAGAPPAAGGAGGLPAAVAALALLVAVVVA